MMATVAGDTQWEDHGTSGEIENLSAVELNDVGGVLLVLSSWPSAFSFPGIGVGTGGAHTGCQLFGYSLSLEDFVLIGRRGGTEASHTSRAWQLEQLSTRLCGGEAHVTLTASCSTSSASGSGRWTIRAHSGWTRATLTYLPLLPGPLLRRCAMRQTQPFPSAYSIVLARVSRRAGVGEVYSNSDLGFDARLGSAFRDAREHDWKAIRISVNAT